MMLGRSRAWSSVWGVGWGVRRPDLLARFEVLDDDDVCCLVVRMREGMNWRVVLAMPPAMTRGVKTAKPLRIGRKMLEVLWEWRVAIFAVVGVYSVWLMGIVAVRV